MKSNSLRNLVVVLSVISMSFGSTWGVGTYSDLVEKYNYICELGVGQQGLVGKYKYKNSEKYVAIKKIFKLTPAYDSEKFAFKSKEILSKCPYFCKPIEYFEDNDNCYFVYEYIDGFSVCDSKKLKLYMKNSEDIKIFIRKIAIQFMIAFGHLYNNGLSYNDLNYGNVILVPNETGSVPVVKIIDYGFFRSGTNGIVETYWDNLLDILEKIKKAIPKCSKEFSESILVEFFQRLKCKNFVSNHHVISMSAECPRDVKYFQTYEEAVEFLENVG